MTNPNLPTAAEALALAYDIVRTPCSAAETARAEVLFEIARELRAATDMRALNARRAALDEARNFVARAQLGLRPSSYEPEPVSFADLCAAADGYAADFAATQVVPKPSGPAHPFATEGFDEATQYMPIVDEPTTQFAIVWQVGDKADCAHCHTPIILTAMLDEDGQATDALLWRHKYSGEHACADVHMSPVEGGGEGHTFAEPSR